MDLVGDKVGDIYRFRPILRTNFVRRGDPLAEGPVFNSGLLQLHSFLFI